MDANDDIYRQHVKKNEAIQTKVLRSVSTKQIVIVAIIGIIIFYYSKIKPIFTTQQTMVIVIGLVIIAYLIFAKQDSKNEIISIEEAKALLTTYFKSMQIVTKEFTQGHVIPNGMFVLKSTEKNGVRNPYRWVIGLTLIEREQRKRTFIGEIDPIPPGRVTALREVDEGFDGSKTPGLMIIKEIATDPKIYMNNQQDKGGFGYGQT